MKTPVPYQRMMFIVAMVASAAMAENPQPLVSPGPQNMAVVRSTVAAAAPVGEYLPRTEREPDLAVVRSRDVIQPAPQVAAPLPNQFVASLPGQVAQSLDGGVTKPLAGQVVRSLPGQSVKPLTGQIVQALPGQIIPPLPGQVFR